MENENEMHELWKQTKMDVKAKSFNIWKCLSCEGEPEFEHPEMMKHMRDVHGIDTNNAKGSARMLQHLDARDWYQTNTEITVNGFKFIHYERDARHRNDMMRFV